MQTLNAKFIKSVKTKPNPKKDNNSWTIIHFLIPEAIEASSSETAGALVSVMIVNETNQFQLVKGCRFGDDIEVESVPSFAGGRAQMDFRVVSVGVKTAK